MGVWTCSIIDQPGGEYGVLPEHRLILCLPPSRRAIAPRILAGAEYPVTGRKSRVEGRGFQAQGRKVGRIDLIRRQKERCREAGFLFGHKGSPAFARGFGPAGIELKGDAFVLL
jgi:hypothetical protein